MKTATETNRKYTIMITTGTHPASGLDITVDHEIEAPNYSRAMRDVQFIYDPESGQPAREMMNYEYNGVMNSGK